jgi:hypothetical protein
MEVKLHSFLTSAMDRSEWSILLPCHIIPGKISRCPFNRMIPVGLLNHCEPLREEKILFPLSGIEQLFLPSVPTELTRVSLQMVSSVDTAGPNLQEI